ncbi:MAG TPA: proline iminopeptidase-family hydrolase [Balneolaceae bacterium]|nr:proline iminopeptidase-family hydrolase [Balneolaceae bacterium]
MRGYIFLLTGLLLLSCSRKNDSQSSADNYYQYEGAQKMNGGSKMVEISTPDGKFHVWTKQIGNNPDMKVLILHGGPGGNHFWYQSFNSYLPAAHIQYFYYDQLGSWFSDQPRDTSLWNTDRFVDEVEQVRKALGLDKSNFYLYGHSWGGILAIEYALKYQQHLKGLIISNMMSSVPAYNRYAENVLSKQMDPDVLAQIQQFESNGDYDNPQYMDLLMHHFYNKHILRMPVEQWPVPVTRGLNHLNEQIYVQMQGPSEFGITDDASLSDWDRTADLSKIKVPTLVIGAKYDTMDPEFMKMMSDSLSDGRYLYCPNGSHMDMYDDQQTYFNGLIKFINDVNTHQF